MIQYATPLPVDQRMQPMQEFPSPKVALSRNSGGGNASSVITLNDNATVIEVAAIGGSGAVIRWVPRSDTEASVIASGAGTNYDHVIGANSVRRFVVPIEQQGVPSIVGINIQAGLYNRVAVRGASVPASSVLLSQY